MSPTSTTACCTPISTAAAVPESPSVAPAVLRHRALAGFGLSLAACFTLDFSDGLAKLMTGDLPILEIVAAQYLVNLILAAVLLGRERLRRLTKLPDLRLLIVRSLCLLIGNVCFMAAVKVMELADVIVIGFVAQLMIIRAYALAPASLLAPFQYLEILGAVAVDYLLFADLPDLWTVAGIALIVVTSLTIAWWEARSPHHHHEDFRT